MDITLINRKLKDLYGTDLLGQPIFRLVWSDDEVEKRFGTFRDFIPGTNVLIREVTEVRECKKYSFLDPQYVLEKLFHNQHNTEILDNKTLAPSQFTYEPLRCFGFSKKTGELIRPVWRAVEFLIKMHLNPEKLTPSQMDDKELERAKKDEELMLEILNANIKQDAFTMSIHDGDTVILNNMDMLEKKNAGN